VSHLRAGDEEEAKREARKQMSKMMEGAIVKKSPFYLYPCYYMPWETRGRLCLSTGSPSANFLWDR
jgi:hypothetical protein